MKKLSFIRANKTKFGGAENYLSRLSQELTKKHVIHTVQHSPFPKFLPSWFKAFAFNIYICITKQKDSFYFSLERITCPDIYRAGDGVHKAFLKTKKRSLNPLNPIYLYLEKRCFTNAKHIIANSQMVKDEIIKYYEIDSCNISVIHNGVPIPTFDKTDAHITLSKEFNLQENTPIILYVGSGFERKGVRQMLHLLAKLSSPFQAFIVGKEKKLSMYQTLAKELGIAHCVTFTGARSDVAMFYAAADLFLFPTTYEPFSNVILEAMSYANIAITTKQNGASEILENTYIMPTPEDTQIITTIEELLSDSVKRATEQKKHLALSKNYTIETNVEATLKVINAHLH